MKTSDQFLVTASPERLVERLQEVEAQRDELARTLELIADGLAADGRTMDGMTKAAAVAKARAALAKLET